MANTTTDKLNTAVGNYTTFTTLKALAEQIAVAANTLKHESGWATKSAQYADALVAVNELERAAAEASISVRQAWHRAGRELMDASNE